MIAAGRRLNGNGWIAFYANRCGRLTIAGNALGRPIICDSKELALSVAKYRRRRLQRWRAA